MPSTPAVDGFHCGASIKIVLRPSSERSVHFQVDARPVGDCPRVGALLGQLSPNHSTQQSSATRLAGRNDWAGQARLKAPCCAPVLAACKLNISPLRISLPTCSAEPVQPFMDFGSLPGCRVVKVHAAERYREHRHAESVRYQTVRPLGFRIGLIRMSVNYSDNRLVPFKSELVSFIRVPYRDRLEGVIGHSRD